MAGIAAAELDELNLELPAEHGEVELLAELAGIVDRATALLLFDVGMDLGAPGICHLGMGLAATLGLSSCLGAPRGWLGELNGVSRPSNSPARPALAFTLSCSG